VENQGEKTQPNKNWETKEKWEHVGKVRRQKDCQRKEEKERRCSIPAVKNYEAATTMGGGQDNPGIADQKEAKRKVWGTGFSISRISMTARDHGVHKGTKQGGGRKDRASHLAQASVVNKNGWQLVGPKRVEY